MDSGEEKEEKDEELNEELMKEAEKMNILNSIDINIDVKAKEKEIKKKLEILMDVKLREMETSAKFHLKKFLDEEANKYDKRQSSKNLIDDTNKIEYLDKRLSAVEIDLNRVFNNYSFISEINTTKMKKYEGYLEMEAKMEDIKRRMKIILLKIYELDDY